MEAYTGRGGIAPLVHNFEIKRKEVVNVTSWPVRIE